MTDPTSRVHALGRALGLAPEQLRSDAASDFPFHRLRDAVRGLDLDAEAPATPRGRCWWQILRSLEAAPPVAGAGRLPDDAPDLGGLEDALDVHQALEVRLVEHRLALMAADLDTAARTLAAFSRVMRHHLAVEEAWVTPRYVASAPEAGWPRGADPRIVDNEHGKIRARLDELAAHVEALRAAGLPDGRRHVACMELLDREKVFHDLLEHHDLRERTMIYPHLAGVTDDAVQERIVLELLDPGPWNETPSD